MTAKGASFLTSIWRAYLPLAILWAAYHGAALTVLDRTTSPVTYELDKFIPGFLPALPFFLFGVVFFIYFQLFVFRGGELPGHKLKRWAFETPWLQVIFLRFLPAMYYVFLLQRVYLSLKSSIPDISPYKWDLTFLVWDRALLFGQDAWQVTHSIFGSAYAAQVIDEIYILWIYVLFAGVFVAALQRLDDPRRTAYLVATGLSWAIAGSLTAILFSSAGPAYVERLFGDATYAPLMTRLEQIDQTNELSALQIIERLWKGYSGIDGVKSVGISAFPSMHLCMATLNTLYAFRFGRLWGWVMAGFTAMILIGSVHLGWHYLVDGLAGIAFALLFWNMAALFARWWHRTD